MISKNTLINLAELEELVEKSLDKTTLAPSHFDYYRGGAADELTMKRNCQAFAEISIWPRMLVDISKRDMSLSLAGQEIDMPIVIAPTAFQALAHSQGELATAAAAKKLNTIMTLSTLSNHDIEEVAKAGNHLWYQLYVYKDRAITKDLVARAEANNYKALVVTVDSPVLGRRERDIRNHFTLPPGLRAANLEKFALGNIKNNKNDSNNNNQDSDLASYIASLYDTSLTWKDLEWIISLTKLPVLVKGVLRGDDAIKAVAAGAKGIIVSNHGGRQLDTTISTIEALPGIIAAIEKANSSNSNTLVEVLLDGGIRRGTDILKALAMGAKAVMIGRPVLWGLALSGQSGVEAVLNLLKSEFDLAMALSGCGNLAAITSDLISREK
ncbi:MAG: 4-hydroxymandelate oxidase [Cyanobacteriota bacterium erpe_2018_sw_21hr_WHONDRS-SW48-000092_B_bin.40]|jgi:4-hydroxymandelate oxidase|nr:4-hydroxymandelate oxidase [Cyanobacteriota bacterium erpe_2018_sw_21hr_WHONDRS-SW48-000092_B_bin.40]